MFNSSTEKKLPVGLIYCWKKRKKSKIILDVCRIRMCFLGSGRYIYIELGKQELGQAILEYNCVLHSNHFHPSFQFYVDTFHTSHIRAIPCQRSKKKGQCQKVDFFNEMWKIIGQIDDFDRFLNNSCNLGVFLAKNKKYPKMTVLKKWKLKKNVFFWRLNNLFQISYIFFL